MTPVRMSVTLRERLGEQAAGELNELLDRQAEDWRKTVVDTCIERFDSRLSDYARRDDVAEGFDKIVNKLADVRVELVRWSFAFWIGQIAVILAALFAVAKLI